MEETVSLCLSAIADLLEAEGRTEAAETAMCLRSVVGAAQSAGQWDLPPTDAATLRALLMTSPLPLASRLAAAEDALGWGLNPVSSQVAETVSDVPFVVANLLGPDGIIHSETYRAGLYYQRPGTRYGLHSHAAVETYAIIAGWAYWTAGEAQRWLGPEISCTIPAICPMPAKPVNRASWLFGGGVGISARTATVCMMAKALSPTDISRS